MKIDNTENTGRVTITIEDVRQHLATTGQDPRKSNSRSLREALGRGSMGTIQKHLVALRAELAPKPAETTSEIPRPPTGIDDIGGQVWRHVWPMAEARFAQSLNTALLERDTARAEAAAGAMEIDALTAGADTDAVDVATATAAAKIAQDELAAIRSEAQAQALAAQAAMDRLGQDLAKVRDDAAHELASALASAARDLAKAHADAEHAAELAKAGMDSMNQVLARMTDQIGELKAFIFSRASLPVTINETA